MSGAIDWRLAMAPDVIDRTLVIGPDVIDRTLVIEVWHY